MRVLFPPDAQTRRAEGVKLHARSPEKETPVNAVGKTWIPATLTLLAILVGCDPTPSGVVVRSNAAWPFRYAEFTPEIFIERPDGQEVRLDKIAGPFYVLAFITPPPGQPCEIDPAVQKIADALYLDSTDVIQITLPTDACPLDADSRSACRPPERNLKRFFDPERIAWKAFYEPLPGTVQIIDRRFILSIQDSSGHIGDPQKIIDRAHQIQQDFEADQRQLFH